MYRSGSIHATQGLQPFRGVRRVLRPHETADKWIVDDGERAGMDYYGEARCMVGLVLERGEERRGGGLLLGRLVSRLRYHV